MGADEKFDNKAQELGGKGKEALGKATGNEQWQAEGQADQTKGNLKQAGEKIKDVFKK
ncbi:MAG: CsbD family protein [Actinomycetes bacterium]